MRNIDTISEFHENHQAFKLNWTHQFFVRSDGDNPFGENVDSMQKNSGPLSVGASKAFQHVEKMAGKENEGRW